MLISALVLLASAPAQLPVRYIGRFNFRDAAGPRCQWSASAIETQTQADQVVVKVREKGDDYLQTLVDGQPTQVFHLSQGDSTVTINLSDSKRHVVRLVKRTEAFVGVTQFLSVTSPTGSLKPTKAPKRRIEVIGDSISCAFGNEGKAASEPFKNETENADLSYGNIAAKALGADCTIIAWSGRKMWPDNTTPSIYDLVLPTDTTSTWDFNAPAPQAVVINLATNDFGQGNPEEAGWTGAYKAFINRLRVHYPNTTVYCAIGSMMSDNWPPKNMALSTLRGYLTRMVGSINSAGDAKVHVLEFDVQKQEDGIGASWHPNIKTHQKMAAKLVTALKHDLSW